MLKEMVWKKVQEKYGPNANRLYIGSIAVGAVSWNALKSRNDVGKDYVYSIMLPGIKGTSGAVPTEEDAKSTVEAAVKDWFSKVMI